MSLLEKSILVVTSVVLLTACPGSGDGDGDTPVDSDRVDTDSEIPVDTGLAQFFFRGGITTDGAGGYVDGNFGIGMYGRTDADWACSILGNLPYEGTAAAGCPDCAWSFNLGPIENSVAEGTHCDQFFADGDLDGLNDFEWGFAEVYEYTLPDKRVLTLDDVLFINFPPSSASAGGWSFFAYNYGDSYQVTGDATALTFDRPQFSDEGQPVYYYYDR